MATRVKLLIEFNEMLFHQYAVMKDYVNQQETSQAHCEMVKLHCGEMSTEYAEALYLKAKALQSDPDSSTEKAFSVIKQSIHIWTNTPQTGGPRDLQHAMSLIMKATILCKDLKKYRWSIKVYRKAAFIISEITNTHMNTETLLNNIA